MKVNCIIRPPLYSSQGWPLYKGFTVLFFIFRDIHKSEFSPPQNANVNALLYLHFVVVWFRVPTTRMTIGMHLWSLGHSACMCVHCKCIFFQALRVPRFWASQ